MTDGQKMYVAYVVLVKLPLLQHDLCIWNRFPPVDKTWVNMLAHFRVAQADLTALPVAADLYHQANSVNTMTDLVAQRLLDSMPPADPVPDPAPAVPDVANAALTQRETSLASREAALLTQMQEMMTLMRPSNHRNTRGHACIRNDTRNRNDSSNDRSNARSNST